MCLKSLKFLIILLLTGMHVFFLVEITFRKMFSGSQFKYFVGRVVPRRCSFHCGGRGQHPGVGRGGSAGAQAAAPTCLLQITRFYLQFTLTLAFYNHKVVSHGSHGPPSELAHLVTHQQRQRWKVKVTWLTEPRWEPCQGCSSRSTSPSWRGCACRRCTSAGY